MVRRRRINFIVNPVGSGIINLILHYPRTHSSNIAVFHHSNCERSELICAFKLSNLGQPLWLIMRFSAIYRGWKLPVACGRFQNQYLPEGDRAPMYCQPEKFVRP